MRAATASTATGIAIAHLLAEIVVHTGLCDYGTRYQSKIFNPAFLREKGLPFPEWMEAKADVPTVFEDV